MKKHRQHKHNWTPSKLRRIVERYESGEPMRRIAASLKPPMTAAGVRMAVRLHLGSAALGGGERTYHTFNTQAWKRIERRLLRGESLRQVAASLTPPCSATTILNLVVARTGGGVRELRARAAKRGARR